jgi:hypothetical protein
MTITIWRVVPFMEILYLVFASQCLIVGNCYCIVSVMDVLPVPWSVTLAVALTLMVALFIAEIFQSCLQRTVDRLNLEIMMYSLGRLQQPTPTQTNKEQNSFESSVEIPLTESVKDSSNQQRMTQDAG